MNCLRNLFGSRRIELGAPLSGRCVSITTVSDPAFAQELLGKGIAIIPTEGRVIAPCDAVVNMVFETCHALSLEAEFGAEILIHVGLDTVKLKGKYFRSFVNIGDWVKKGQLLMEFDLDAIAAEGYDTVTPMVICNSNEFKAIETNVDLHVTTGEGVLSLVK